MNHSNFSSNAESERPRFRRKVSPERVLEALLIVAAAIFGLMVLVYMRGTLRLVFGDEVDQPQAARMIARVRAVLALGAFAALGLAAAMRWVEGVQRLLARPAVVRAFLVLGFSLVPLLGLELLCRPFPPPQRTTIYQADAALDWRHRPGVRDYLGGVPVTINAEGLRGPSVPYQRTPGASRVLFLGDSVTFGFRIEDDAKIFVRETGDLLAEKLERPVETINGGTGGWAAWQEALWLRSEGVRYAPDLVVVGFVLNDVTEPTEQARFGGKTQGSQLGYSFASSVDRLFAKSAFFYNLRRVQSGLSLREEAHGAAVKLELINVTNLLENPESPAVQSAWQASLSSLTDIARICREQKLPIVLVCFPYLQQFASPQKLDHPQRILGRYAERRGITYVDLLPGMLAATREQSVEPSALYIDDNHPSELGSRIIARELAAAIEPLLPEPGKGATRGVPTFEVLRREPRGSGLQAN